MIRFSQPKIIQKLLYRGDRDHDDEEEEEVKAAAGSEPASALAAASSSTPAEQARSEPTEGTLALLYDEIGSALAAQHDHVESLNARAQQLLGFATIILAILSAVVPTHPGVGTRILYGIALPVFAVAAYYSGRAWRIRGWRFDPSPLNLWEDYRLEDERVVREKVIANRRESLAHNRQELERKLRLVKRAEKSLYVGFIYVAIVLLYQVIHG